VSNAQREALTTHRRRRRASGVVRVEVQVPAVDAAIVRDLAAILRGEATAAQAIRSQLRAIVSQPRAAAVFDIFGSDLPDSYFDGVFEHDRHGDPPRDLDL
jgi:hypothetical protein